MAYKYKRQTTPESVDDKAPLKGIDRSKWAGFIKYWRERPAHFRSLFGVEFNEESAAYIFKTAQ